MTKEILITGACGFLGRHVGRAAARAGDSVFGIGRGTFEDPRAWGFDACKAAAVTTETLSALGRVPDLIIHCAGSASATDAAINPLLSLENNFATAAAVLEQARVHAARTRVVLVSSTAIYGEGEGTVDETQVPRPVGPYGNHKSLAENLARWYAREHGVKVAIVRFASLYGIGSRKQILWEACGRAQAGQEQFPAQGDEMIDLLHVEDAAKLLLLAADVANETCPGFLGGSGEAATVKDVVTRIYRQLGASAPEFAGPRYKGFLPDIERARGIGFAPKTDWRSGADAYVNWYHSLQLTSRQRAA